MTWDWQELAALLLVVASAAYLARRGRRLFARPSRRGCATGGCGSCPSATASRPDEAPGGIVPIDALFPRPPRR